MENSRYILCLGANTPDAHARIASAVEALGNFGMVRATSGAYRTAPEYAGESEPYLNEVLVFDSSKTYDALQAMTKAYERSIRSANTFEGLVNLDIDIVVCNGAVVRPKDAAAAYFREGAETLGLKLDMHCLLCEF